MWLLYTTPPPIQVRSSIFCKVGAGKRQRGDVGKRPERENAAGGVRGLQPARAVSMGKSGTEGKLYDGQHAISDRMRFRGFEAAEPVERASSWIGKVQPRRLPRPQPAAPVEAGIPKDQ